MAIQYTERMRPEEAFKRGFYYGIGFWVAGIFIQVVAFMVGLAILLALGIISTAALRPSESGRTVRSQPIESQAPVAAPSRRR